MPREMIEIKKFVVGTVLKPSTRDISIEAASNSYNLDSLSEYGILKSIKNDLLRINFKSITYTAAGAS